MLNWIAQQYTAFAHSARSGGPVKRLVGGPNSHDAERTEWAHLGYTPMFSAQILARHTCDQEPR